MAEKKQAAKAGGGEEEEEVPAFFKNLGSGSPKPRQKFCGMFCPVEGSLENKTIDFDSLSSGRGSPTGKIVAKQRDVAHLGPDAPAVSSWQGRKVEIRRSAGKEALQNLNDKVSRRPGRWVTEQVSKAFTGRETGGKANRPSAAFLSSPPRPHPLSFLLRGDGSSELQAELEESPTHLMQGPEL